MMPEVYLSGMIDAERHPAFETIIVSRHSLLRHSLQKLIEPHHGPVRGYQRVEQLSLSGYVAPVGSILLLDPTGETSLCRQIQQAAGCLPGARVVLLLKSSDELDMTVAIHAGARGCIAQEAAPETIASIISLIADDHVVWPFTARTGVQTDRRATDTASNVAHQRRPHDFDARLVTLSKREIEVLERVGEGLGNKRIASSLHISDTTVRLHMRSIMRKLGAENRTQVALFAMHGRH
ncbi:response regulator transcription factor [Aureimonas mangrovi]|uniref:response regulator transcription factor n=1 Tax=Aureimonas mangrovi TaxID=2758041 RepID=UPI00163DB29D|nr:response regulator transcription factor [Aureimonas mangrovi]